MNLNESILSNDTQTLSDTFVNTSDQKQNTINLLQSSIHSTPNNQTGNQKKNRKVYQYLSSKFSRDHNQIYGRFKLHNQNYQRQNSQGNPGQHRIIIDQTYIQRSYIQLTRILCLTTIIYDLLLFSNIFYGLYSYWPQYAFLFLLPLGLFGIQVITFLFLLLKNKHQNIKEFYNKTRKIYIKFFAAPFIVSFILLVYLVICYGFPDFMIVLEFLGLYLIENLLYLSPKFIALCIVKSQQNRLRLLIQRSSQ